MAGDHACLPTSMIAVRHHRQDDAAMKSKPNDQLLAVLQQTVSAALTQWLDDNKGDVLLALRDAVLEKEPAKHECHEQPASRNRLLTVAEVAQRWQLHPESVRRMIR